MIVQRYHTNKKSTGSLTQTGAWIFWLNLGRGRATKTVRSKAEPWNERAGPPASYLQPQVS